MAFSSHWLHRYSWACSAFSPAFVIITKQLAPRCFSAQSCFIEICIISNFLFFFTSYHKLMDKKKSALDEWHCFVEELWMIFSSATLCGENTKSTSAAPTASCCCGNLAGLQVFWRCLQTMHRTWVLVHKFLAQQLSKSYAVSEIHRVSYLATQDPSYFCAELWFI